MNEQNVPDSQQPNSGAGTESPNDAAKPNEAAGTVPPSTEGQGASGDKAGGDAGKDGAASTEAPKDGTGDGQAKPDDKAPLTGAPEAYAGFALPEGFTLEGERKDAAETLFRDLGLSQAGAQRAIDHFLKTVGEDEAMRAQALEGAVAQQRDDWGAQAKAELGDKYDAEVNMARTAVLATQNPKLIEAFNELGWGNHPEMIKAFALFGRMMRDSPVDGIGSSGGAQPPKSMAERMYPKKD